jgi:hypothetical protein
LANFTCNRYLAMTGEYGGLAAFPLFLSCRAAVRAKVCAMTAASAEGKAGPALDDAKSYLADAIGHLGPPSPRLIALGGLSGTGKSTLAMALAPALGIAPGAVILRSDVIRKRLFGQLPEARLPPAAYQAEATRRVYAQISALAETALRAGYCVLADAAFLRHGERAALAGLAGRLGLPFQGLWLEAPAEVLLARVEARRGDASDAGAEIVQMQSEFPIGEIDWRKIDAAGELDAIERQASQALAP